MAKKTTPPDQPKKDLLSRTEDSIVDSLLKYKSAFGATIAAAVVIGASWAGFNYYTKKKELSAQAELARIEAHHAATLKKITEESQDKKAKDKSKPSKEDLLAKEEQELTPIIQRYESVAKTHSHTKAAKISAMNAANLLVKFKKHEAAEKLLQQALKETKKKSMFFGLLQIQLGTLLAEKEQCDKALSYYQKVVGNKSFSYLHPQALLKQGVCYTQLKQYDQAQAAYERIINEFKGNAMQGTAKSLLRLLKVSQKGS